MRIETAVAHIIYAQHGWAVAEQFKDTFEDRDRFYEQNSNALDLILREVTALIERGPFSDSATFQLENYRDDLINYMDGSGPKNS